MANHSLQRENAEQTEQNKFENPLQAQQFIAVKTMLSITNQNQPMHQDFECI